VIFFILKFAKNCDISNLIAKIDLKNDDWFLKFFQISRQSNKNNLEKKTTY